MPKKFIWLLEDTFPAQGPRLVKGREHDAADFEADAVKAWVASGAARWANAPAKKAGRRAGEEE